MSSKRITASMIERMSKQSLRSGRMRNIFVMVTIALASALLTAILMFAAGQKQREKNALSGRQQVGFYELTDSQMEKLVKDERIAYQIQVKSGVLSKMDGFDVMPYYVSELSDQIRVGELEDGRLPKAEDEIAVQAAMLEKMDVMPSVGSSVTFSFYDGGTETFNVTGILKGSASARQFSVFLSEKYARNGSQLKDRPFEVYAKLCGASDMGAEECRELMYQVGSDAGIERKYVAPSKAFLDTLSVDMQSVTIYGMVGMVILLACILVVYGVFYLSVIGRIHQFGQLRTIGMTKKQMRKFVSREGGLLFLGSSPAGIAVGAIAGYLMIPDGFHPVNLLLVVLFVFAVVYVITMISVHKPARLASAVSPMEALRYVPEDTMDKAKNRKMCRKLTPLSLGIMNFAKNRKKTVITMLSLGLGGILFMTAAAYMSSFDMERFARQGDFTDAEFNIYYSLPAIELDEYGMSGLQASVPLGEDMIKEILSLDGVRKITEIKGLGINFDYPKHDEYDTDDGIGLLTEKEAGMIGSYLKDGSADYEKLMSGEYVLVAGNDTVKEIYGWEFETGDRITLHFYDGSGMAEKEVTILGILDQQYVVDHKGLDEGWFLMPEAAALTLVSYDSLNQRLLISTEPEKEAGIGEYLAQMIADRPELDMETLAERKVQYEQNANQLFGAISGLAVFIMMFSILSMMNTLITNIVTRKKELAMLESIGMSKGQLRRMLLSESLFLVLVTVGVTMTAGTACGYVLSHMLYNMGVFYMAFRFPAVLALAYAGVLIFVPLVITFVSMHGFSREALVERLRGMEN